VIKTVHSKPIDAPETAVFAAAVVACILHLGGFVVLNPMDYGVAVGAVLTPVVMFVVRLAAATGSKVESVVADETEESEES